MKLRVGVAVATVLALSLVDCGSREEASSVSTAASTDMREEGVKRVPSAGEDSAEREAEPEEKPLVVEGNVETRARIIVDLLAQREFDTVAAEFDAALTSQMSPEKLKESWQLLNMRVGTLLKQETLRSESEGGCTAVFVTCAFELGEFDVKIVFDTDQRVTTLRFLPTKKPVDDTPPYAARDAFTEEDVAVDSPEHPLPGTLTLPNGEGPFPAVVLIHGTGPHDRDESMGPNKPFRDLAWGLASRGIAVLRYDKRTKVTGGSAEELRLPATVKEEVVDDAVSAAAFLQGTSHIDKTRIFALGHSLGAMLLPRIVQQAQTAGIAPAGLIAMAAPGRPIEQTLLSQTIYLAQLDDEMSDDEYARIQQVQEALKQVEALKPADAGSSVGVLGIPNSYWLDLKGYDAPVAAQQATQPWLILQGERDYQVNGDDLNRWKGALSYRKDVTFKTYPVLNHLFMLGEGPSSPADYETLGHVDVQVIADIAEWITKLPVNTDYASQERR